MSLILNPHDLHPLSRIPSLSLHPLSCTIEPNRQNTRKFSDGEKSEWRKYTDPKEFFEFAGLDQKYLDAFLSYYLYNLAYKSFEDWLVVRARSRDIR